MSITPKNIADLREWYDEGNPSHYATLLVPVLCDAYEDQQTRITELEAALKEIALGKGRYSRDQLEHAENTIEDMRGIAQDTLNGTWELVKEES